MRLLLALVLCVTTVTSTGCMTLFSGGSMQNVSVSSDPGGAVAASSGHMTRTPGVLRLDRAHDHVVYITRDGYKAGIVVIESKQNPVKWVMSVLLNAAHGFFTLGITFVVGMAIDIGTGSLQELSPRTAFLPLSRWETVATDLGGEEGSPPALPEEHDH